ncbi:MAG: hypothetical protein WD595_00630, partial [Waddliaceae bacterium]
MFFLLLVPTLLFSNSPRFLFELKDGSSFTANFKNKTIVVNDNWQIEEIPTSDVVNLDLKGGLSGKRLAKGGVLQNISG